MQKLILKTKITDFKILLGLRWKTKKKNYRDQKICCFYI